MTNRAPYLAEAKKLLILGLPLMGSQVAQFAVHTTDTVMMGWYSVSGLAAVTLGSQIHFIMFVLGSGIAWAVMPLIAAAVENQDERQMRRITRMGLWLSSVGFAVMFLPMWFSAPLLEMIGQPPDIAQDAQTYLRIAGFGLWPVLMAMVLRSYLSALEHTGVVLWVSLAVLVLNAGVNYILIFGYFGAPEMGLRGAAIASLCVSIGSFLGFVIYIQHHFPHQTLFARLWRPDWGAVRSLIRLGIPISLTGLAESGLFAASAFMMGALGTVELAAHGIVLQLAGLTFMMHWGLSQATTVRAGRAFGRMDGLALKQTAFTAMIISALYACVVIFVFLAWPQTLITAFIDTSAPEAAEILRIGMMLLFLAALFQMVDAAQVIALGLLRGMQDTRGPMIWAALSYWGVGMPVSYLLGFHTSMRELGVWTGLVAGLGLAALSLWARYFQKSRVMK